MKNTNRVLALILSVIMVLGMLPFSVFASSADSLSLIDGKFTNSQLTIANEKNAMLAPGIMQDSYVLYNNKNEQVKMWVTTADVSVDTVKLFASYKDMDPTNYGMSKLTEQVASFNEKAAAGDTYYQGTVVAGINSSYYNMITGKPTGAFVMNGIDVTTESEGNAYGYFAVMKDGTVKIGNKGDYSKDKGNIQEAIGIYTMLIVDGQICSGLNTTQYYPRQTIGITAEGKVILMTADGNQAPKSIGLTVQEQAQAMLDLGCVWAGHLDGGGSCTYAAKAEGSNDFGIVNSPSDGSERSISNGFIIVSTAVSDGKFASAALTAENEYVTPGSTVAISAIGVDKAGGSAVVPNDVTWQLADASFGSVTNGTFVSSGKVGAAVVQMVYDGKVVGETTVNVVIPTDISFMSSEITVPYGKNVALNITAVYGAKKVILKPSDIKFTLSASSIGAISGFDFTAGAEGVAATESTLTAAFVYDESITAATTIKLGKGSEVVYDFEDGTNQKVYINEPEGTKYNYVWPESEQFVSSVLAGDKVHSGSYALGSHVSYANSLESGYMKTSVYATETRVFENAVGVGAWIYIPDECVGLWARWTLLTGTVDENGNPVWTGNLNSNTMDTTAGGTGIVYTFKEPGWHYLYADTSAYSAVGWKANGAMMQFYISDRDGSAYKYVASENSNIPGNFTFYIDDITVDYSSAVDDREAPVFSNVTYATEGMPDAALLNGNTITTNKVTIAASLSEYTGKSNFTGLDEATIKAYVDGVEYQANYANGKVSINDLVLTNGKHVIKFSACDKMGNYGYIYQYITVNAEESKSTIKLVPTDASLDRIKLGSIYNMDIVATAIEEVAKVEIVIDLDNNSTWQLDHMTVAAGFTATYRVDTEDNIATIVITRTGKNTQIGGAALATLPVRVWTLKTGYVYANGTKAGSAALTLAQFKSMNEFWRMSVIANVDKGVLTRVDNTVDTFSGERVFCDTEMWANYGNMTKTVEGKAYYDAWDGGHVHSAHAIADKTATCTENGYTGRTFCDGCNSVVEWGTTIPATGHTHTVTEGVLKCACGDLFSGVYTDGKTYVDGIMIADGWNGESYYKNGVKLTGLQEIGGYYYDFGDNGVCENKAKLDGFYYNKDAGAYMYFASGMKVTTQIAVYPTMYYFDEKGFAVSGEKVICGYTVTFSEYGEFVSAEDATIVDAGYEGNNIEYVVTADGTLIIDGQGAIGDYTNNGLYAPWFVMNRDQIFALVIGNGITEIGEYAFFNNAHLKKVTFEEGCTLRTIAAGAFSCCHRLPEITIPASVEVIEELAFFKTGAMKNFYVEENSKLHTIGREAFNTTLALQNIYIPSSVTTIGKDLFKKGNASTVMHVVEGSEAYYYAIKNNISYSLVDGVVPPTYSGKLSDTITWGLYPNGTMVIEGSGAMPNFTSQAQQPWAAQRHLINSIVIGKDITSVGNYAFAYAQNVTSVTFEEGSKLTSVGVLSFRDLSLITEIVLPETVTALATYAFGDCDSLVNVYIPQDMKSMHTKAFINSANVVLNVAKDSYAEQYAVANGIAHSVRAATIHVVASGVDGNITWTLTSDGVITISGSGAMADYADANAMPWKAYLKQIKHIVIGKDVTTVGNYAFAYASNTQSVTFEEGSKLTKVGVLSFFYMMHTTEIVLPETVTYIGSNAFGYCANLAYVYIPQEMANMHFQAFRNSTNVILDVANGSYAEKYAQQYGISYSERPFIAEIIASGVDGNITWTLTSDGVMTISGSGAMNDYADANAMPWKAYLKQIKHIVIGKDITSIGNYAFAYAYNVESVTFEEGSQLTRIGVLSFFYMMGVTEVDIPDTVNYIGSNAFGYCTKLTTVDMPTADDLYVHHAAFRNTPYAN